MKAIKATYKNGKITLSESPPEAGPVDGLVMFPEAADDPWQSDPRGEDAAARICQAWAGNGQSSRCRVLLPVGMARAALPTLGVGGAAPARV